MLKFTLGHDAEVFLQDNDGQPIPSIGLIGGDKAYPRKVDGGALQEDNVMAELNIDPANSCEEWINNTNKVKNKLEQVISKHQLKLSICPVAKFQPKFLKSKQARLFGCDPDQNIYTGQENIVNSEVLIEQNLRTAGGHIHIGLQNPDEHPNIKRVLVQACDVFIGLPLATLEVGIRKDFYGRAGSFRSKSYGIEYRTPSNIWLKNDEFMAWVYGQACDVVSCVSDLLVHRTPTHQRIIDSMGELHLRDIIDSAQADEASYQCNEQGIRCPEPSWLEE